MLNLEDITVLLSELSNIESEDSKFQRAVKKLEMMQKQATLADEYQKKALEIRKELEELEKAE